MSLGRCIACEPVDKDPGSDDPRELHLDVAALATNRSGSSISESSEETAFMPILGAC